LPRAAKTGSARRIPTFASRLGAGAAAGDASSMRASIVNGKKPGPDSLPRVQV
jgi:hypothetical protein